MSTTGRSGFTPRTNMPAFGAFGTQQPASLLFEKSNPGLRRSTPDSEALASSDDEVDQGRSANTSQKLPKPTRRTSWLNDVNAAHASTINRKPSITAQYSPSGSNPGTPGVDQPNWSSLNNSAAVAWNNAPTSSPWGSIWSQDQRNPPSRLHEVMAHNPDSAIPFSIPLQPTPKTYRSQSYSVGQLDTSSVISTPGQPSTMAEPPRTRLSQNPSLQRRTSRTSGLGLDSGGLGRVREVEDDEEEGVPLNNPSAMYNISQPRHMTRLDHENLQIRSVNPRDRTMSATSSATVPVTSAFRSSRLHGTLPEEYDTAVDDHESMSGSGTLPRRENGLRRMSEQAGVTPYDRQNLESPDARAHDNTRKAQWSTTLGFGSIPEAPQSRRHSLADVPTRHGSLSSHGIAPNFVFAPHFSTDIPGKDERSAPAFDNLSQDMGSQGEDPAYFATTDMTRRAAEAHVHSSFMAGPYGHGQYVGPSVQPLHIVNFKCCRSDVFFVQEGTGLQVSVGDLVIVEADRGTDLGTVQHVNVTWDEARRYKEHYAEEHYKWLMMFSQQSRNGGPNVLNPNGLPSRQGSAVGGMGPPGHGGHGGHDAGHNQELKPKLIKRLAQNHEIQTLKDKEGNEAKAKRNCQQKVLEHRLNMEILDAEFQMDGKKLTFYYFADTYINFNSLVTDLFKVYKTRIWMSAINPASFQTPTASLGLQPAFPTHSSSHHSLGMGINMSHGGGGAGNAGPGRDSPANRRRNNQHAQAQTQSQGQPQPHSQSQFSGQGHMPFTDFDDFRSPNPTFLSQYHHSPFSQPPAPGMPFGQDPNMSSDPFQYGMYGNQYPAMLNPAAPNFSLGAGQNNVGGGGGRAGMGSRGVSSRGGAANEGMSPVNTGEEWMGRFQGLSLGSQ